MNSIRRPLTNIAVLALLALAAGCAAPPAKGPEPGTPGTPGTPSAPSSAPPTAAAAPVAPVAPKPVEPVLDLSQQELAKGIKSYEDGSYPNAARQLQTALNFGLAVPAEQAQARKYLAFIQCGSNRMQACRDEFRKAFAADPAFDLAPAEAGHPTWGPVFRAVKAEQGKPVRK